jgi:hypothetical protein
MSHIGFCERGGQDGIVIEKEEQYIHARLCGYEAIDEYIPLPNMTLGEVVECEVCSSDDVWEHAEYWENEKGSHGWCCNNCGRVIQWG